jgi:hypothetical protein
MGDETLGRMDATRLWKVSSVSNGFLSLSLGEGEGG